MTISATSPDSLAAAIVGNLGGPVDYAPIPVDGARLAAEIIFDRAALSWSRPFG